MPKDYKATLNLPKTDFPMKANLAEKELTIMRFWEENDIYEKIQAKNKKNKPYILHDGPPYANGRIHIGHALNKILKDIVVKYKSMKGFYSPFVPGWDCHGLPIELQVEKNLGEEKDTLSPLQKRRLCREYAETFIDIQRYEFRRLGVFGDWKNPYLTMSYKYEASIVREFINLLKEGYVYKMKKPVYWCLSCATALAEAEVEYFDKESPSIYVKFRVQDVTQNVKDLGGFKEFPRLPHYFLIWTTTAWTLPANMAIAVHPDVIYSEVMVNLGTHQEVWVIADALVESSMRKFGFSPCEISSKGSGGYSVICKYSGRAFEGIICRHPFADRTSKVILGEFVNVSEGLGIVHIAPGHGEDDYEVGLRYGLDVYSPVDEKGRFKGTEIDALEGKLIFEANTYIIDLLKDKDALIKAEKVIHSYPHCWRCKEPVIFRATEQWFISVEHKDLRKRSLEEINTVTWIPKWGRDKIYEMVSTRPNWCISRQRVWGAPITLISCNNCNKFADEDEVFEGIVKCFEENGADIWFEKCADELLPSGYKCKGCGGTSFSKETDILDVWFDSGVSHAAMEADERLSWPADMYLEGADQYRGWFQSSLITSVGKKGKAPYKTVLTHGFVVDGYGKKMSKSLGNIITPGEVIKTNGADILRLWASAEDYRSDVRLSKEILERLTEAYRKIRNTCRFLLGNLYDFDVGDYSYALLEIDRWAMSRLQTLIGKVTSAYENYNFHEVFHALYNFCVTDMSSFYLDVLKDRLYTFKSDSVERRAAQWVLYQILLATVRLMAPVLSFTSEEIWQNMRQKVEGMEESVFLSSFPEVDKMYHDPELEKRWENLLKLRDEVNKALEVKRAEKFIGNSLEAKVILYLSEDNAAILKYRDFLPTFFIVSAVDIVEKKPDESYKSEAIKGLEVKIERAPGQKCQRCWNWSDTVGRFLDEPEVCERCYRVIYESARRP